MTVEDLWTRELDKFEESYRKDLKQKGHSADGVEYKESTKQTTTSRPTVTHKP